MKVQYSQEQCFYNAINFGCLKKLRPTVLRWQCKAELLAQLGRPTSTYHHPAHLAWYWPMIWQLEVLLEEQELQALAGSVALLAV